MDDENQPESTIDSMEKKTGTAQPDFSKEKHQEV
jgi:hypothetical protein